jgi:hypothetical protein
VGQREKTEFTTRAVATLVKFVLVSLPLVYIAILYAYAIKIGLAGVLPKGTLGSLMVGYLLTGAATLLLVYPSRDSGGALVRLFWRYWLRHAQLGGRGLFHPLIRRAGGGIA